MTRGVAKEEGAPVAYIFCEACQIGFHSNVRSCPECGRPASRAYRAEQRRPRRLRLRPASECEDMENEVREAIYGWRSGTVERCDGATRIVYGL